ncbi:MAG TPA: peptide ABC transporter substrate-binding protein [Acidimicrobiales bacterium]|nr:peptide ABC transporter substrate-binding protein [Acidimicrobiales bacterium]
MTRASRPPRPFSRRLRRRAVVAASAAGLAVAGLAGCGPTAQSSPAGGAGGAGGGSPSSTYPMGDVILPSQMANINPFQLTGNWSTLFSYLYSPLYYFDPVDGSLVPDLAKSGQMNASGTTYTVTLNNRAHWQNGPAVTAADVVYTYDVLHKYPAADPDGIWSHLSGVTASGDTVTFRMSKPYPTLPYLLSQVYIVPKAIWGKYSNPLQAANMHPVGSGPWELASYQSGVAINLKRNPNYFLGAPKLDRLSISMYSDSTSLTLDLEKGAIDTTAGTLAMPSLPTLLKTKTNKFQKYPGTDVFQVLENDDVRGLDNVDVRRAIQAAINQKALIQEGELGGVVRQNPGWVPPIFKTYLDAQTYDGSASQYSPSRAKALLEKAGYSPGAHGQMEKDGKPLSFTYYEQSSAPAQDKEGQMIEGWLNAVGIGTKTRLVSGPELTSLASTGNYQLMQMGVGIPPDPVGSVISFLGSASTAPVGKAVPGLNYSRFKSPALDKLLSQASAATTTAKRRQLLDQAQQLIASQAPVAVMYDAGGHTVYRTDKFTGYDPAYPVSSPWSLDHVTAIK